MKKFYVFLVGVFLLVGECHAYDDHDFQVWNTDVEELKINKSSKITLEEEFRWGDNAEEFYYHHYDLGYVYNMSKHLNVGLGYRQIFEKKSGKFKGESAPYGMATLFWDAKGFKFDDRSRLEYRHFDYQTDFWRYRNKITIKLPLKFTKLGIAPYLSDEIFLIFGTISQFNENRFSTGFSFDLTKNIKVELYYMLRSTKGTDTWVDTNVLGTKFKVVF
jgi:hypothetical protein